MVVARIVGRAMLERYLPDPSRALDHFRSALLVGENAAQVPPASLRTPNEKQNAGDDGEDRVPPGVAPDECRRHCQGTEADERFTQSVALPTRATSTLLGD